MRQGAAQRQRSTGQAACFRSKGVRNDEQVQFAKHSQLRQPQTLSCPGSWSVNAKTGTSQPCTTASADLDLIVHQQPVCILPSPSRRRPRRRLMLSLLAVDSMLPGLHYACNSSRINEASHIQYATSP